jgi:hypothetical protein
MKRYAFWRSPGGMPCKTDRERYSPRHLLALIGEHSQTPPAGGVVWNIDWAFIDKFENAVHSLAVILTPEQTELNDQDSGEIIRRAIGAAIRKKGGGKPVSPAEVLLYADRLAAEYFRKPKSNFTLITSLSIHSLPSRSIKIGGCEIAAAPRNDYPLPPMMREQLPVKKGHASIGIRTNGRSYHEATTKALDAMNILRGLWTFLITRGSWQKRVSPDHLEPIGIIHGGHIHTLHFANRNPVGDFYWYDLEYPHDRSPFAPPGGWETIEKRRRWAVSRLRSLPYSSNLADLFARYAVALDHLDHSVSLLQLWSILEKATDTVGGNYDETISRSAWCFDSPGVASEFLSSLRLRRNRYVHSAQSRGDNEQAARLVKDYVDDHLGRLLRNDFRVKSLREYGEHIALPRMMEELTRQRNRLSTNIRLLRRWDRNHQRPKKSVKADRAAIK